MATTAGACCEKNTSSWLRDTIFRKTTFPKASTPQIEKVFLARSRPKRIIKDMGLSTLSKGLDISILALRSSQSGEVHVIR